MTASPAGIGVLDLKRGKLVSAMLSCNCRGRPGGISMRGICHHARRSIRRSLRRHIRSGRGLLRMLAPTVSTREQLPANHAPALDRLARIAFPAAAIAERERQIGTTLIATGD